MTTTMRELSTGESLELLRTHHLGRLAFIADGIPLVLPVNYVFEEPSIVVRTAPGTKLVAAPMTIVALEVDDSDPDGTWGWSVVARGPASDITASADEYSAHLRHLPVQPAAPGERTHWLKISAVEVSGRRFG